MANGYWMTLAKAGDAQVKVAPNAGELLANAAWMAVLKDECEATRDQWYSELCGVFLDWHDVLDVDGRQIPFSPHNLRAVLDESPAILWATGHELKTVYAASTSAPKH